VSSIPAQACSLTAAYIIHPQTYSTKSNYLYAIHN
jgi:hypothetical protein